MEVVIRISGWFASVKDIARNGVALYRAGVLAETRILRLLDPRD